MEHMQERLMDPYELSTVKLYTTELCTDELSSDKYPREAAPVLTSDIGGKAVLVLVHTFLLPQRAYSEFRLSIHPLRYNKS